MKIIEPAYQSVNLCFASNEKYAPHLATVLYSLLKNCDTKRMYDIIILHKDICRAVSYTHLTLPTKLEV